MEVATGEFWSHNQLENIGEGNSTCQHCGQDVKGPDHVLWDCPGINQCGKHCDLKDFNHNALPKAIKSGLTIEMNKHVDGTFWGAKYDQNMDDVEHDEHSKTMIGVNYGKK